MKNCLLIILTMVLIIVPTIGFSQDFSDYLILQDINQYKLEQPQKVVGGYIGGPRVFDGAGVIAPTGHFYFDHTDKTYEAYYEGGSTLPSPTVQVTQHTGSDSDKWLLHEVERGFRKSRQMHSVYISANPLRTINNNKIFYTWGYYTWMSNNVVVYIQFTDMTGTKPEPLEIVQAYLQKFPSTISSTLVLDQAHSIQWIKDEMERRLWLCDKWFTALQQGKAEMKTVLQQTVGSMQVFLDYREKYYGIKAQDEKNLLAGYLSQNNGTAIKNKLTEYKTWWSENKGKAINL